MRLKTNVVISVLFIALLGFVYFYEIKGGEERRVEAERERQLLDFSDHEVQKLTIDRGDTLLVLERQDDTWRLTSPVQTGADAEAVERYLRTLGETEVEGDPVRDSTAVAADPTILAEYGLEEPRLRVHIRLPEDGTPLDTLRFGDDTPTDRFTYVQRGGSANPEILRVRAWRFDNLHKTAFDLRDRRLLAFEADEVRRLRLQRAGEPAIEATREGGSWTLEAPVSRRADDGTLNGMLRSLQDGKTDHILLETPSPQDLELAGLTAGGSTVELTLWIGDDRVEKRLRLGVEGSGDGQQGSVQALDSSRPHVFLIDSTVVTKLHTSVADLRDKKVFRVDADSVAEVALLEGGDAVFAAHRDTSGNWTLADAPGHEAKVWRLNSLLTDLNGLEAIRFAADAGSQDDLILAPYGLDTPQWTISITRTDGRMTRLHVGNRGDGEAFVLSDAVASVTVIDDDTVESLHLSFEDVATQVPESDGSADPATEL
ncbi:MAG TPA: DUF4340 domain-containing protein [Candidatus Latescibacteria bacterium]|jgi:hypothetical protein|nr:DUF4340 domain-containing protein [Candidatus Latescibacterota bacterium]HJP30313.1 DUF4340 domain-containing protein [Candidatus Latescibacterota bacterium]